METPAPALQIGYARVSTTGQTLDAQLDALKAAGCVVVYCEKASGAARKGRTELSKAIAALPHGGTLTITRLDRLGRSITDIWQIVREIEDRGAVLRSIGEAWMDTSTPTGRLLLSVLGWMAEMERGLILERTAAGRERAKRSGKKLGRPRKLNAVQLSHAVKLYDEGKPYSEIGEIVGADRRTVSRALKVIEAREAADRQSASLLASVDTSPLS